MPGPPVINGRIRRSVDLSLLTSIGVGGKADYLIDVYDLRSLKKVLHWLVVKAIDYMVIGSGTNIIFSDRGYHGGVIRLAGNFKRIRIEKENLLVGAGLDLKKLIRRSIKMNKIGLEKLYGIPGTVGGAIRGNAGAYGKAIGDFVKRIWVLNPDGEEMMLSKEKINFTYRRTGLDPDLIITLAEIRLSRGKARMQRALSFEKRRWGKIPRGKSAGCIFKNPEGKSSGRIIEECGLKGKRIGGAFISPKHANFIINDGTATFGDILKLIKVIREKARVRGFDLELEVRVVR